MSDHLARIRQNRRRKTLIADSEKMRPAHLVHLQNSQILRSAFGDLEATRLNQLKFSVLEVMDLNSAQGEIDRREAHWKRVLLTRRCGHNWN